MPRRGYCEGFHDWKEHRHQGAVEFQCSKCPAMFPCREPCAHTDCEAHTGRTAVCPICKEEVAFNDGFHVTRYSKLIRVCAKTCRTIFEDQQPDEASSDGPEDPHEPEAQEQAA